MAINMQVIRSDHSNLEYRRLKQSFSELLCGLYLLLQGAASSSGCTSYIQVLGFHVVIILHLLVQESEGSGPPSSFENLRWFCVVITTHQNVSAGNCFELP